MAGYGITVTCTRETLSCGAVDLTTSAMMETSTSLVVVQRRKNSRRTNRKHYLL